MSKDKVNLLPPELRVKEPGFLDILKKRSIPLALIAVLVVISFCAGTYFFKVRELERVKNELDRIAPAAEEIKRLEEEIATLSAENVALEKVISSSFPLSDFLDILQYSLPSHLWLDKISLQNEGIMIIEGKTLFLEEIGFFASRLQGMPYFQEVKILSATSSESGLLSFKIEVHIPDNESENEDK